MRIRTAFKKLLRLQGARVRQMDFRMESQTIWVSVARRAWRHRCPHSTFSTFSTRSTYDRHPREWRHLSLGAGASSPAPRTA
jgi:hypothetical protein